MSLKEEIQSILKTYGCMNQQEICRLVNGHGKRAVNVCSLTFKEKPYGKSQVDLKACRCPKTRNGCKVSYGRITSTLRRMPCLTTVKMRFWDKNKAHKRFDIFRFWFIDYDDFRERILAQTLIPYVGMISEPHDHYTRGKPE